MTAASLRRQALAYLARYAASRAGVERFLRRRLQRAEARGQDCAPENAIPPLLDDLERLGLIDDAAFAATKAASLARRGLSAAGIAAKLSLSGVPKAQVAAALAALELEGDEEERAWHYARRRRLGPYRPESERGERRLRDLASLTRRGFPFEVARAVIDADEIPPDHAPGL
ncbi:MAG: RecX family transcriptional regulator [Pseudomonadota bacterium]